MNNFLPIGSQIQRELKEEGNEKEEPNEEETCRSDRVDGRPYTGISS